MSVVLAASAALALLPGCLGDVDLEQVQPGAPDSGQVTSVVPLGEPPCVPGATRCNGSWVERCFPSGTEQPPRWTRVEDCLSGALCGVDGVCQPPACVAGEIRCAGAIPQRCRDDLTDWESLGECISAAHCSLNLEQCNAEGAAQAPCCSSVPCEPDVLRCNASDIQRCRADRSDLDLVANCATPVLCETSLSACDAGPEACQCTRPVCAASETRCSDGTLERCNADQTAFEFVEKCATRALCELGRDRSPLSCQPPTCQEGGFACSADGALSRCNVEQTGFDVVEVCPGGAAFCNAAQGRCTETPCQPGERRCDGAQVLACRDDQTGFVAVGGACATEPLCVDDGRGAAGCQPPACDLGDVRCAGSQLQRCNDGRTDFANVGPACLRADLCSAERQRCDFCVPSRRECTPDLGASRTCAADGSSFGQVINCPLGCIANTGACQTCDVGSYTCDDGQLSRCYDGFSFTPLGRGADCAGANRVTCNGDTLENTPCGALGCNPTRNACNQCTGQVRVCDGAASFRGCQADGTFGPTNACQAGLLCTGAGQCVCTPNVATCSQGELFVCNGAGNAIVEGSRCSGPSGNVLRTCDGDQLITNTCGSADLCDAATGADCPQCLAGDSTCSPQSGQPLDCIEGELVARGPCPAGLACQGAGECRCAPAELRCEGAELLACNADGTAFEAAPSCVGATLRTCSDGVFAERVCASGAACAAAASGGCPP